MSGSTLTQTGLEVEVNRDAVPGLVVFLRNFLLSEMSSLGFRRQASVTGRVGRLRSRELDVGKSVHGLSGVLQNSSGLMA